MADFFDRLSGGLFDKGFEKLDRLFDSRFEKFDEMTESLLDGAMKKYEENQKYPSLYSYPFTPVPSIRANELKAVRMGLFGGSTKKAFIAAIENGKTAYLEVLVLSQVSRVVRRGENPRFNTRKYFYKVADLAGNVIREDVPIIDDESVFELPAVETGCADVVEPALYPHAFIVNYYLMDDSHYVLLSEKQFDNLAALMKHAGSFYHRPEDGVGYQW